MLAVDAYASPIHYRTSAGWIPIDNALRPDPVRSGWVVTSGNEWTVAFGPSSEGMELSTPAGVLSVRPVDPTEGLSPSVAPVPPEVEPMPEAPPEPSSAAEAFEQSALAEPAEVAYEGVRPGVDLIYTVSSSGVKEEIVVAGSAAGAEFVFDVTGTSLALRDDGGIALSGAVGEQFEVPPPTVTTADGADATGESGVRYEVRGEAASHSGRLAVVVDPGWLAALPADRLPARIDPSFQLLNPQAGVRCTDTGGCSSGIPISVGRTAAGVVHRGAVYFDEYEQFRTGGWRMYNAYLRLQGHTVTEPPIQVFDQGSQPGSFAAIGAPPATLITDDEPAQGFVHVATTMDRWLTQNLAGQWFGLRGVESGVTFESQEVRLDFWVYQPPQPSFVTNVADQQVLATTTPLLQAQPVPFIDDGPGNPPRHPSAEFQITTSPAPGTGLVLSSGEVEQTSPTQGVSWAVPQGTLQEGVSYWAWVLTHIHLFDHSVPPVVPPLSYGRRFTVDLGLGDGGPSPTDEVGSVPGRASSPSEGAPGPSLPGSKVTVNLVDGNLSLSMGTRTMGTLSGGVALSFTYNSLTIGNQGLRAEFFNDTNNNGEIDAGDVKVGDRVDPTVSWDWSTGAAAKAVAAHDPNRALGRWTGFLTVPSTGTWQVGAISSDGLRATVNGTLRLDRWATHEPEAAPVFGSSFTANPSTPLSLSVEWKNSSLQAVARVYLRDVTNPSVPVTYNLSPAWLHRTPLNLAQGWLLNAAAGQGRWVGLADRGTSVSVFSADGSAHEFKTTGNGAYTPPITAPNDLLSLGDNGRFVLRDAGGATYTFRSDGSLESLVSASDDRNPAALMYGYSGSPVKLRTITDPVSSRVVSLSYGGDPACSGAPPAAAGLLCHIGFWDGSATTLGYDPAGRFVRLTNPGGIVHDFAYDSTGRLTDVRDPLAYDAIAAGVRADDVYARTHIVYYADGKVFIVAQPTPAAGTPPAQQPYRSYAYDPVARTGAVYVAGFTPTTGFAQRTRYDARNRIVESTGSDGLSTAYDWDSLDRLVAVTDTAGLKTTTIYDHASRPGFRFGPAPQSSFGADGFPVPGATVPASSTFYDVGMAGLAAAYWANPYLAGGPALHDTGLATNGAMSRDWGTSLPVVPGPGGWSARWSGFVSVAAGDTYTWRVRTRASVARVWVDDVLVVERVGAEPPTNWAAVNGAPVVMTAGAHRIRVDMVDASGPAGLQVLWSRVGAPTFVVVPGSVLSPNYGLVT
ncbi:MAG: PA14 domain-containing protein, partial [Acidimicrobiales bacterium]